MIELIPDYNTNIFNLLHLLTPTEQKYEWKCIFWPACYRPGRLRKGKVLLMKSTYCKVMQEMAETLRRNIVIFNLDPAAEYNEYRCDVDIQELVTL